MKMNLLVVDLFSEDYRKILQPKFPEISIHAFANKGEVGSIIEKTHVLLSHARGISDEFIKKASRLQWIQALGTGVDGFLNLPSLKKDVLITSARGIHGPQMSEMAFLLMLAFNRNFPQVVRNQDQRIWERCDRLRKARIPFIVISPQRSPLIQKDSMKHGASGLLVKPLGIKELMEYIHTLLGE